MHCRLDEVPAFAGMTVQPSRAGPVYVFGSTGAAPSPTMAKPAQ
jgi:hypothetical protein